MSRSNPTQTNPAGRWFKWSGSEGKLVWWDKELEKEIEQKMPFEFLVLDELHTITGYSDQDQSGYWSNEVKNISRDELTVRTKNGIKGVGVYRNLQLKGQGAKYTKSVYIAYQNGDTFAMGNVKLSGAALTAWIEFCKTCVPENGKVTLTGFEEGHKGATTYCIPTFVYSSSTPDEDKYAIALDKELQAYLIQYLAKSEEPVPTDEDAPTDLVEELWGDDIVRLG